MAAEVADFIWQLNSQWPTETDSLGEAKDHLFSIKNALVNTFPNFFPPVPPATTNYLDISSEKLNDLDEIFNLNTAGTPPQITSVYIEGKMKLSGYNPVNKYVALKFNPASGTKIEVAQPNMPVGSVIASPLSVEQIDALYGTGTFLLCDGVAIIPSTSLLGRAFPAKFDKVPDYRDRIITQNISTTKINDIGPAKTRWRVDFDFNNLVLANDFHDHNGFIHSHMADINWVNSSIFGTHPVTSSTPAEFIPDTNYYSTLDKAITTPNIHDHSISVIPNIPDQVSGNNYPNRVILNYYLRVN